LDLHGGLNRPNVGLAILSSVNKELN
jgi:hypothetical protein